MQIQHVEVDKMMTDYKTSSELCSYHLKTKIAEAFTPRTLISFKLPHRSQDFAISELKAASNCELCRLILKVLSKNPDYHHLTEDTVVNCSWAGFGRYHEFTNEFEADNDHENVVYVSRLMLFMDSYLDDPSSDILYQKWIQVYADPKNGTSDIRDNILRGRKIGPCVDIDLLKSWVQHCETVHGQQCSGFRPGPLEPTILDRVRLIDISNRNLVSARTVGLKHFATLSYTWGPQTVTQLKLTQKTFTRLNAIGGLSSSCTDIPTTVKDAMDLCHLMDIPYLWVDALCIQ